MKIKKMSHTETKNRRNRSIAVFLALSILFQCIAPTCAYALTGGPSQPEVQSFEPIGTSDMVDLFSGDFNYNIPLMDIDGYPINISYHSGVTMDQEASWVGLGWNINAGVINRSMRGIPDDFNGEKITKELKIKDNKTYSVNTGAGIELFGLDKLQIGLNYTIGVKYNNYTGVNADQSLNISLSSGKSPLTGSLGINSSSEDGLSLQPKVGLDISTGANKRKEQGGLSLSVGSSFNSRAGLKALTLSASQNVKGKDDKGNKISAGGNVASSSFDLGMPTYTPQAGLPMQNLSVTGSFKVGLEAVGLHPNFRIGGAYSCQKLMNNSIENSAYGYMNADEGAKDDFAIMDFNREKDGSFTPNTPALPVTNFTYDIFSVAGQGVGGSYRPFRSDMGHVFDPYNYSTSSGYSVGAELGVSAVFHVGVDLAVNDVSSTSGRWKTDAASRLTHKGTTNDPLYEKYYFKEANEKSVDEDTDFYDKIGKAGVQSIALTQRSKFNTIGDKVFVEGNRTMPEENYRKKRQKRNQPFSIVTAGELSDYGLESPTSNHYMEAPKNQIAEITTLKTDGSRYVYGLAAYNKRQEEVTFAVGKTLSGTGGRSHNTSTGLVSYSPGDNSASNENGIDNYYSNTIMPAYAHSYMLTAVLSPDYVDSDYRPSLPSTKGPSDGDIGNYTKFAYSKVPNYKWRIPVGENMATYNEGLKSDETDDKGNYLYGEKDLLYLDSVTTKNYIAVFTKEDRKDGYGVLDKNGKRATSNPMKLLRKISLYSKRAYRLNPATALPVKEVYFEYDYSLCPKVPNNIDYANATNNGKLTLTKIYFSYQGSNKARLSPYTFKYSTSNPAYNIKGYDRWGNYKPLEVGGIPTDEFPYVDQNKITADQFSQAWSLTEVYLPSGGKIKVEYESDDYAYVQDKQAGQMFKVVGVEGFATSAFPLQAGPQNLNFTSGARLIIKLQESITGVNKNTDFQNQYLSGIDYLYFRFLMNIKGGRNEYVSGYLTKADIDFTKCEVSSGGDLACIAIKNGKANDNDSGPDVCPITKAAIQFGRLNMPRTVYSSEDIDNTMSSGSFGKDLLIALINSSFFNTIRQAAQGPNKWLYEQQGVGAQGVMGKSWLRLNNPDKKKLGGGCRVSKIKMSDEWDGTGITENTGFSYGQEYLYTLTDGTSSGVASYEPQLGGDENPWKQPVFFSFERLLAPDDEHYMEEPFGECFFPSPSVGYSRVTVQNLQYGNVTHNATGKTVHEFYTAKDYPTITQRTRLNPKREKKQPLSLSSMFNLKAQDYMTASQGYIIELNDMHGKPKKQEVYQQAQTTPITSVEYAYQSDPYLNGRYKLNNTATVINSNGSSSSAQLGVFSDFVSDMRESYNETTSSSFNFNTDGFIIPPIPAIIPIPVGLPSFANEKTQFRSAVVTKVIQRFGILSKTVAKDLGSVVETKNLAYDAETGEVLLTETTTNYNDKVYALSYPAYWYYNGMGPAYKNQDFKQDGITFTNGLAIVPNALAYFAEGDEIAITGGIKAWVLSVSPGLVKAVDRSGGNVNGQFIRVLRSGRRNQQSVPMATITTLSNPLPAIASNAYEQVLQAQAMEFTNGWRTFCDCFSNSYGNASTNPYILGTKGMYKNKRSYLYLTDRSQSNYNNNTNIRKDGVFTSYSPYYRLSGGAWTTDSRDWTYTSEVTEFSPFGVELENKDALGRYSAAEYGYNQTLPVAVAANSRYKNVAYDNFEDYAFSTCADNHFKFRSSQNKIVATEAHTGRNSIKIQGGTYVDLTKQLLICEPAGCALDKQTLIQNGETSQITLPFTGGAAPYSFEWESTNCDLVVKIDDSGTSITINQQSTACKITVIVTDKNNCKKVFPDIEIPNF